jgi:hypothetical protein
LLLFFSLPSCFGLVSTLTVTVLSNLFSSFKLIEDLFPLPYFDFGIYLLSELFFVFSKLLVK